jgi:hypothetical protein
MFKNLFFLAIVAGLFGSLVSYLYSFFYFDMLVDFSEAYTLKTALSYNFMITTASCLVSFGLAKVIKNQNISTVIFNLILSGFLMGYIFMILKMEDPVFKNEDASLMIDYFKGFQMPLIFIPALSWFSFSPLFLKR